MPYAMTANETITGLNTIFIFNLISLPFTYRRRKTWDVIEEWKLNTKF